MLMMMMVRDFFFQLVPLASADEGGAAGDNEETSIFL